MATPAVKVWEPGPSGVVNFRTTSRSKPCGCERVAAITAERSVCASLRSERSSSGVYGGRDTKPGRQDSIGGRMSRAAMRSAQRRIAPMMWVRMA